MSHLKELHITESNLRLDNNIIKGGILPNRMSELSRTVNVVGETVIEGPLYASRLTIEAAPFEVTGAVFTQQELYINNDVEGSIIFRKAVGSASSIVYRGSRAEVTFSSDINAKEIDLTNTFVAGSLYGDNIVLENCVVIGGVFATQSLTIKNCIIGTFISPYVELDETIQLLLPSVFSMERIHHTASARLFSLALADLGALYRGAEEAAESGKIAINLSTDDLRTTLTDEAQQRTLHSYSVVGKVLAADLIDTDKFQNHFLLTAAALGNQLLKNYDMGTDNEGNPISLSIEHIRQFFFQLLTGKISAKPLDGAFNIEEFAKTL